MSTSCLRPGRAVSVVSSPTLDARLLEVLATPEGQADPYPRYARMREEARVSRTSFGPYVVNGYDECQAVLRDPGSGRGVGSRTPRPTSSGTAGPDAASSSSCPSTTC